MQGALTANEDVITGEEYQTLEDNYSHSLQLLDKLERRIACQYLEGEIDQTGQDGATASGLVPRVSERVRERGYWKGRG